MKRVSVGLLISSVALLFAAPVFAAANPIAGALGNLRWGMNEREVRTALKDKLRGKDVNSVEFDGRSTTWDNTPVAEEYTHGNEETMLAFRDADGSENYYFFIGGQLWKWSKYYSTSAFGGSDFNRFADKIKAKFGTGHDKTAQVNPGSGASYHFLEFIDRNTRLRAVDKAQQQQKYVLMFEAMDTVRSLSSLRSNTIRRATVKQSVARAPAPEAREPVASAMPRVNRPGADGSNAKKSNKSIFTDENQGGESESAYNAKKQRAQQEQRHTFERKEEAKKGKILDDLAGMEDDDPISGAK